MSCSEIQVTILGDIADVQELIAEIKADKDTAAQAATDAINAASAAQRSANQAEQAPVNLKTMDEGRQLGAVADAYNFVGEGVKVTKLPNNAFNIEIPGVAGVTTIQDIQGLSAQLNALRNQKFDGVTSKLDEDKKEIVFTFTSGGNSIATDTIDLNPLFGKVVADAHEIYFGFSAANPATPTIIKQGASARVRVVNGHDIKLTRSDTDLKHMFVWVPDIFGVVTGFKFSGTFVDQWQGVAVTVDGVAGKVYMSDNQTGATSVSFEVEQ